MRRSRRQERSRAGTAVGDPTDYLGDLSEREKPVRKNHYLYQSKIDMVKEILGAGTETEALDAALDLLIYGEALALGTESVAGDEYEDVLGIADEAPTAESGK